MGKRHYWQQQEIDFLKAAYPIMPNKSIAEKLGISELCVIHKAYNIGLRKDPEYIKKYLSELGKELNENGKAHRFPKGHIPSNKGKKMSEEQYAIASRTFFKKGGLPPNTLHDGCIRIRNLKSGKIKKPFKFIRVSKGKWEMLQVHNWIKTNGPVPDDMMVTFKNGDTLNCEVDNLELITKEESMRRTRNSDEYIASLLSRVPGGRGLIDYSKLNLFKQDKDLLDLKRQQIQLNDELKKHETERNDRK